MDYIRELRAFVGHRPLIGAGVRAIIRDAAGDVLLQLRGDFKLWGLPAGGIELGESVRDALCREVMEETGLTVVRARPFGVYSHPRYTASYPNGDVVQPFVVAFLVDEWTGTPTPDGDESLDLKFFPLDAPPPPEQMVSSHRTAFRDVRRFLETGELVVD
jgi:8-oxo-dGTP pyrophosphatase MutT (NUDIX family)